MPSRRVGVLVEYCVHDIHPLLDVVSDDPSSFPPKFVINSVGNLNANIWARVKKVSESVQVAQTRKTG